MYRGWVIERSEVSRWCRRGVVVVAVALGCDVPPGDAGKEPAEAKAAAPREVAAAPAEGKAAEGKAAEGKAAEGKAAEGKAAEGKAAAPVEPEGPATPSPGPATPSPGPAVAPEPPSPEPVAPAPTPAGPALAPLPVVVPSDAALSEKMKRRLRSKLREQHDALTQLPSSLALPQPDGSVVVLALYEHSAFEACVSKSDGSPEARKACANPTDDNDRVLAGLRKCTIRGLVRARFGPPPASQPAYGGELTVEATRPLQGGCTVTAVRAFSLEDVDGDGQPELALDLVTKTPRTTFRTATPFDAFTRTVGWYRADLTPQHESDLCRWQHESLEEGGDGLARRFRLEDSDGDGRADLRIESVDYVDDGECELDEVGWLKTAGTGTASEGDTCAGKVETTVHRYDPEQDAWIEPASASPR